MKEISRENSEGENIKGGFRGGVADGEGEFGQSKHKDGEFR